MQVISLLLVLIPNHRFLKPFPTPRRCLSLLQPTTFYWHLQLSGSAAIKAKNVCLHLVDQHTQPANHGVVQLFNVPHPKKVARSLYMEPRPPMIKVNRAQLDDGTVDSKIADEVNIWSVTPHHTTRILLIYTEWNSLYNFSQTFPNSMM